ncbi:hypothetical protein [Siminovitchia terrae]|nr:hypothetical protein [Siminovitchia terrae]
MTKELCISQGVNIQPKMTHHEMFRVACERVSTNKLSKDFTFIKDDENEFFIILQEIIFKELKRRDMQEEEFLGDIHYYESKRAPGSALQVVRSRGSVIWLRLNQFMQVSIKRASDKRTERKMVVFIRYSKGDY